MTTYAYNTANTEGVNFNETWTVYDQTAASSATNSPSDPGPRVTPGTTVKGTADSDFVCVKASAAIAAGDVCLIATDYQAAGVTTTNATLGNLIGVAVVAIASGSYGWLQRAGYVNPTGVAVLGACAPNVQLATTATAGSLDDAVTTGLKNITGIIVTVTNTLTSTSAAKLGVLNYPVVGTTN